MSVLSKKTVGLADPLNLSLPNMVDFERILVLTSKAKKCLKKCSVKLFSLKQIIFLENFNIFYNSTVGTYLSCFQI